MDLLAREGLARRLAWTGNRVDRCAVGKTRLTTARNGQRCRAMARDAEQLLGVVLRDTPGHPAWPALPTRPAVLLSQLSPLHHVRPPRFGGGSDRRRGARGR